MIKIKVKFQNKKLWNNFIKIVSIVASILSFILTIIDIEQNIRIKIAVISLIGLVIVFLIMWFLANNKDSQKLRINDTDVIIKYGNIFSQQGIKVIAFNEYLDTQVDDNIISSNSLNGIYINQYSQGVEIIDKTIRDEVRLRKNIIETDVQRPYGGKSIKYKLGSICPVGEFFLLAFTHFDDENRAYISIEDYISCLLHMWKELDRYYSGRPISITLLGSGITRLNDIIQKQDLLKYIIRTYEISKVKFNNTSSLTIVLNDAIRDEINLYNIQEDK